ncbi:ABC transporter ATP-binding protein [uncultured Sphaerochaeta sp.]|uniref:ABC transporter ATP-binding protein n=1 Tax=uncultured Sphaerochaeta sp. TaxID=886478 RepID=UPI002A0A7AEF|nr:ABC transporter ATP-binding protein [uncultured Sphaerochaeta sp.]
MSSIRLENVTKVFGKDVVLPQLSLEIKNGSFTVLVGPSGCGKSTTLRLITGLETPTSGKIFIDHEDVSEVTPGKRNIAMVFQNYALYPTMTVEDNIGFGLANNKVPKQERTKLIHEICETVGLTEYLGRKPATLSGGQRQRVALARAMVKKPRVFLMDEPLSNLDAKLRAQMRVELINLHKKLNTTFIYVTHDQTEAMSMGDDIILMNKGIVVQQSSPRNLYHNPKSVFAAQFIGTPQTNIIRNILNNKGSFGFRPEKALLKNTTKEGISFSGHVATKELLGSELVYSIQTDFGTVMVKSEKEVDDDAQVVLSVDKENLLFFDENDKFISDSADISLELIKRFPVRKDI